MIKTNRTEGNVFSLIKYIKNPELIIYLIVRMNVFPLRLGIRQYYSILYCNVV